MSDVPGLAYLAPVRLQVLVARVGPSGSKPHHRKACELTRAVPAFAAAAAVALAFGVDAAVGAHPLSSLLAPVRVINAPQSQRFPLPASDQVCTCTG